jgi:hypothetical protein
MQPGNRRVLNGNVGVRVAAYPVNATRPQGAGRFTGPHDDHGNVRGAG